MRKKLKTLPPLRPSIGVEVWYRKSLIKEIRLMQDSVLWWLKASYRSREGEIVTAQDASPAREISADLKRLMARWQKHFAVLGDKLARRFIGRLSRAERARFQKSLKDAGFAIDFQIPRGVNNIMQSAIIQNVSLIKSIPQQYLTDVQTLVSVAVQTGKDLNYLARELQARYKITERRAKMIARDQNNKVTAALDRKHAEHLGIKEAVWVYTYGSKEPRRTHVQMDGRRFNLAEGLYDPDPKVRRRIQPGELVNCRCLYRMLLPEMDYTDKFDEQGRWKDRRQSPERPDFENSGR